MEEINTRDMVIKVKTIAPDMPAVRMAKIFNVSKQRISFILKNENLSGRVKKMSTLYCLSCNNNILSGRFCNSVCKHKYHYIKVPCTYCGKIKIMLKSRYDRNKKNNQQIFCDHECSHLWYWKY
ncbi:MAG: hypothetical protein AABY22_02380, partial [Nanoarchaeota archaeon]